MLYVRKYKSLSSAFISLNREIALNPTTLCKSMNKTASITHPIYIECDSTDFSINLADMLYTEKKMMQLKRKYVDQEHLKEFKEKVKVQKGNSITFYFKQKKLKEGTMSDNGPCLIAIVLTRDNNRSKFNRMDVYYRTVQLNRIFGPDLLLMNLFANELPDNCEIKKVAIHIPSAFQVKLYLPGQMNLFNFSLEDVTDEKQKEYLEAIMDKYYDGREAKYKSLRRYQLMYYGKKKWKKVNKEKLKLED